VICQVKPDEYNTAEILMPVTDLPAGSTWTQIIQNSKDR